MKEKQVFLQSFYIPKCIPVGRQLIVPFSPNRLLVILLKANKTFGEI